MSAKIAKLLIGMYSLFSSLPVGLPFLLGVSNSAHIDGVSLEAKLVGKEHTN